MGLVEPETLQMYISWHARWACGCTVFWYTQVFSGWCTAEMANKWCSSYCSQLLRAACIFAVRLECNYAHFCLHIPVTHTHTRLCLLVLGIIRLSPTGPGAGSCCGHLLSSCGLNHKHRPLKAMLVWFHNIHTVLCSLKLTDTNSHSFTDLCMESFSMFSLTQFPGDKLLKLN